MSYLITYTILIITAAFLCRAARRRFQREAARDLLDRTRRRYPLCVTQEDADADLEAIARAIRDEPTEAELWEASRDMWEAELAEGSER